MKPEVKRYTTMVGSRNIAIETGKLAAQAGGAVTVHLNDSIVFAAATMGGIREGIDFFPLSVDYEERMYAGGKKMSDGRVRGWRQLDSSLAAAEANYFAVRQDVKLLDEHIVSTAMARALPEIAGKRGIRPADIDWYLPHYSSAYFRDKFYQSMKESGFEIPYEKWFTNLAEVGNIGSASIYLMMEGLLKSGRLRDGDKVLCFIPESGRFSHCFMLLTVVAGRG